MDRRNFLIGTAGLGSVVNIAVAQSVSGSAAISMGILKTAKDFESRQLLELEVAVKNSSSTIGLIEKNLSRLSPQELFVLFGSLTKKELEALAILYWRATLVVGRSSVLLELLTARLPSDVLVGLVDYFGYHSLQTAMMKSRPGGLNLFSEQCVKVGRFGLAMPMWLQREALNGPTIDYTINEIYLSFRTAPSGSLSVKAALYETFSFVGTRLSGSFGIGYTMGTGIVWLMQRYAPDAWGWSVDNIGGWISGLVEAVGFLAQNPSDRDWEDLLGERQRHGGMILFQLEGFAVTRMQSFGGDFGVASYWALLHSRGEGGGGRIVIDPMRQKK